MVRTRHRGYFLVKVKVKDYIVMIDGQKIFDQPVKNDTRKCDSIQKIATAKSDDYATDCLLFYPYLKKTTS